MMPLELMNLIKQKQSFVTSHRLWTLDPPFQLQPNSRNERIDARTVRTVRCELPFHPSVRPSVCPALLMRGRERERERERQQTTKKCQAAPEEGGKTAACDLCLSKLRRNCV